MKKTATLIVILLVLAAVVSTVAAANAKSSQASGKAYDTGANASAVSSGNGVSARNTSVQKEEKTQQKTLRDQVQDWINLTCENETAGNASATQAVWKTQNAVRVAVHTFLSFGDQDDGIGQNVSAIARQFNNSIATRLAAEEQIQQNAGLLRLLFGGDAGAAGTLLADINATQERIETMKRLVENCTCDNETQAMLTEQIRVMEEEQTRLQELAESELSDKGLFGWLWK